MNQAVELKTRAPRNRTVTLEPDEERFYGENLRTLSGKAEVSDIQDRTIQQDFFEIVDWLPLSFVDLLFLDPPYNLTKSFNGSTFVQRSIEEYRLWLESWLPRLLRTPKPTASVYICGDWHSTAAIQLVAEKYFIIRNRIVWEREKGRGAAANWKNCSEDIWFCTVSDRYTFNLDAVKLKRRVVAPYTDAEGNPKDWDKTENGNYRLTHPSNIWTDLTVPFWSMPENTDHPTQKPEKLLAKVILASSNRGEMVLDPFLGSGTSSVVASKLGRRFVGIESDLKYCCLAEKRLALARRNKTIQGYTGGVFWERNSLQDQKIPFRATRDQVVLPLLYGCYA